MVFEEIDEFKKDLQKLERKYPTLESDLGILRTFLIAHPRGFPPGIVRISYREIKIETEIYKVKHFRCRALRGRGSRSGIRVIYAYEPSKDKIVFIEIYFKEREGTECDFQRILAHFG